jgi:hypothetical protein
MRFAVGCVVRVEAPGTTAHTRIVNNLASAIARKRTLLIYILIHKPKISKVASQQPARAKAGVGGQSILDMGRESMPPHYSCIPSRT